MKASVLTGIGGVKKLQFQEIDIPQTSKKQALVKVLFCGINHLDLLIREGRRPGPKNFPHILGSEIVGQIENIDPSNPNFKKGDIVAVYPWTFCGNCPSCKQGNMNICDSSGTIGRTSWGGYAEFVVVPVENLMKLKNAENLEDTCGLILAGTTAHHLINRANVQHDSTVLVTGATGGVGTIVLQLLKNMHCKIIASTSHPEKEKLLKRLGADHVVSTEQMINKVKKLLPVGVDHAIDIMGGKVWSNVIQILGKNATMSFCATTLDDLGKIQIGMAFSREVNIHGSYGGTISDMKAIIDLYHKGIITQFIDQTFPLADASNAHKKMEKQTHFGKILLKI